MAKNQWFLSSNAVGTESCTVKEHWKGCGSIADLCIHIHPMQREPGYGVQQWSSVSPIVKWKGWGRKKKGGSSSSFISVVWYALLVLLWLCLCISQLANLTTTSQKTQPWILLHSILLTFHQYTLHRKGQDFLCWSQTSSSYFSLTAANHKK